MTAMFVQEGGKVAGDLIRMAFARSAVKARHSLVSTESQKQAASEEKMTTTIPPTEKALDKPIVAKAGTGCRGCTANHFAKCAGA